MLPRLLAAYRKYGFAAAGCPDSANQRCRRGAPVDSMKNGAPNDTVSSAASHHTGISDPVGFHPAATATGSVRNVNTNRASCRIDCLRTSSQRVVTCAYRYPPSRAVWKNSMHVFQTAGVPPSIGSTIFENIGCTANNNAAFTNNVIENSTTTAPERETSRF